MKNIENQRLGWSTWFADGDKMMFHYFSERVTVKTDLSTWESVTYKDGKDVGRVDTEDMSLDEYLEYLLRVERDANELAAMEN